MFNKIFSPSRNITRITTFQFNSLILPGPIEFVLRSFEVILRSFEVILRSRSVRFDVFCFLVLVFDDCIFLYVECPFIAIVYLCKVEVDIASSLAISDYFSFGLTDLISMNFAILSNLYCLIIKSALRSPVYAICSKEKMLFIFLDI